MNSKLNGHEYVDLGLPSGTLWASCNIGAEHPEDYGSYFAWGETSEKNQYLNSNYTFKEKPLLLPKEADAAHVNWGEGWRIPSTEDFRELINECKWIWVSKGYQVVGRTGNSIFLPAAGAMDGSNCYYRNICGVYWSRIRYSKSSLSVEDFIFRCCEYRTAMGGRSYYGQSVRPVCYPMDKEQQNKP